MSNTINKTATEEIKNEDASFPWQASFLLGSLVVGGILMLLKVIGII